MYCADIKELLRDGPDDDDDDPDDEEDDPPITSKGPNH
jgi:hypothetical protein